MDRISVLSDELLLKILLFVPTKVAVSTSILSKRWEYLWMWLPKLNYCHSINCSEPEHERLRCFLDRNLPLHRAPVIESFRLELFRSRIKPENINMWVSTAVSHCLRELEIVYETYPAKPKILPSNLYTCKSLVILKLDGDILLDVPRMVSLPSLKTLKLQSVRFINEQTIQRLLSNCPIPEDLVVDLREGYDTRGKLTVVVPSLQSLSLYMSYNSVTDGYVIETPSLKYFKLVDYNDKSHYCLVENMPYLIEAYVDVGLTHIKSLIGSVTSVKHLAVCSEFAQNMLDEGFDFNQLEHIEVCICTGLSSNQIFRLLKASSKLKRLDISLRDGHEFQGMDDWDEPSTVPECMLSSLQTLNWSTYIGEAQEIEIVVYILKHALHLKTATITAYGTAVQKLEMIKELSRSSRASTTCQLMFH